MAAIAVLVLAIGLLVGVALGQQRHQAPAHAGLMPAAGAPGGAVVSQASSTSIPTSAPTAAPSPKAAARPTSPPAAAPVPTPEPAAVAVAVAGPADTVADFYRYVAGGELDVAYGLWSDRMKATYPRQGNLDERFANTASIPSRRSMWPSSMRTTPPSRRTSRKPTTPAPAGSSSAIGG